MANKIEQNLTSEQLHEFVLRCSKIKGVTLKDIQSLASDYDIEISLMAARSFRDKNFAEHLKHVRAAQQASIEIAAIANSGTVEDINEASASLLAMEVFKSLNEAISEGGEIPLGELSKIISRLRLGDQRNKLLEAKLKEYEAKEEEREAEKKKLQEKVSRAKKSKNGLSKEAMDLLEEAIGLK